MMRSRAAGIGAHHARRTADLRKSIRLAIAENALAQSLVTMALSANVFLATLFTKVFLLPASTIGFIAAVPFACQVLQLLVSPFARRFGSAKHTTIATAALQLVSWIVLGFALPQIPRGNVVAAGWWLGTWFFISSFVSSIAGVWWMAWMQEWVPPRLRGKFFGRRNRLGQFAALTFLLVSGWVLSESHYAVRAFQLVIAGACALRVISLYWLWISPTPAPKSLQDAALPISQQWSIIRVSRPLVLCICFGIPWTFATTAFAPFYPVFMLGPLGWSAWELGILSTLSLAGGALILPLWGKAIDRFGNRPVMLTSILLWQSQNYLWCALGTDNRWLAYVIWAWTGVTSAGFVLGHFTLILKLAPAAAKNLAIGVNLAVTAASAALAPALAGVALDWSFAHSSVGQVGVYRVAFLFQPTLALLSALLLVRLPEPGAATLSFFCTSIRDIALRPLRLSPLRATETS